MRPFPRWPQGLSSFSALCGEVMFDFVYSWRKSILSSISEIVTLLQILFPEARIDANKRHFAMVGMYAFVVEIEAVEGSTPRTNALLSSAAHFITTATAAEIQRKIDAAYNLPATAIWWFSNMTTNADFTRLRPNVVITREVIKNLVPIMYTTGLSLELALLGSAELILGLSNVRPVRPEVQTLRTLHTRGYLLPDEMLVFSEECSDLDFKDPRWHEICGMNGYPITKALVKIQAVFAGVSHHILNSIMVKVNQLWTNPAWVRSVLTKRDIPDLLHTLVYTEMWIVGIYQTLVLTEKRERACITDLANYLSSSGASKLGIQSECRRWQRVTLNVALCLW